MNWRERIVVHPTICNGQPCIKGTEITVSDLLNDLASGKSLDEVLNSHPLITAEDVRAALAYAAASDDGLGCIV